MQEPKALKPACILLLLSLGLYLLANIVPNIISPGSSLPLSLYLLPVKALIYAFLIWQIWCGQNWARIITVFLYLLTLTYALCFALLAPRLPEIMQIMNTTHNPTPDDISHFLSQSHYDAATIITIVLMGIEKTLEAIAIFLLFSETSNVFFNKNQEE
jgi:hypothetical protein